MELERQKVQDLLTAFVAPDALVDFKNITTGKDENPSEKSKGIKDGKRDGKEKPSKWPKKNKRDLKVGVIRAGWLI